MSAIAPRDMIDLFQIAAHCRRREDRSEVDVVSSEASGERAERSWKKVSGRSSGSISTFSQFSFSFYTNNVLYLFPILCL